MKGGQVVEPRGMPCRHRVLGGRVDEPVLDRPGLTERNGIKQTREKHLSLARRTSEFCPGVQGKQLRQQTRRGQ